MAEEQTEVKEESTPAEEATPAEESIIDPKDDGGEESSEKETPEKSSEPVEYDLTIPEGSFQTEADLERTTEFAKKWGLSNEATQAVLGMRDEVITNMNSQAQTEAAGWADAVKKDPELGGAKFNEVSQIAKRGAQRTASPKLLELMNETGLGNHPEVVRHFYKIGCDYKDDTIVTPEAQPKPQGKKGLERLYSKPKEKE